eukprot:4478093-Lingulodinium_polyedra.AAC.1
MAGLRRPARGGTPPPQSRRGPSPGRRRASPARLPTPTSPLRGLSSRPATLAPGPYPRAGWPPCSSTPRRQ